MHPKLKDHRRQDISIENRNYFHIMKFQTHFILVTFSDLHICGEFDGHILQLMTPRFF